MQDISDVVVCDEIVLKFSRDTTNLVSSRTLIRTQTGCSYGTTMVTPTTTMTTVITLPSRFTTMSMYMRLTIP